MFDHGLEYLKKKLPGFEDKPSPQPTVQTAVTPQPNRNHLHKIPQIQTPSKCSTALQASFDNISFATSTSLTSSPYGSFIPGATNTSPPPHISTSTRQNHNPA